MLQGKLAWQVSALHDRYEPVVRIAPNELSFLEPGAWKEVYGVRLGGVQLEKYTKFTDLRVDFLAQSSQQPRRTMQS
jgi:hypothetical protein